MKSVLSIHWKDWYWNSNTSATWCEELTHWKRLWCWERLKAGGEGNNRRWVGWMASPTQWTWVWASSGSWWWKGKPGMLQYTGSQRIRHSWATELNNAGELSGLGLHSACICIRLFSKRHFYGSKRFWVLKAISWEDFWMLSLKYLQMEWGQAVVI